MRALSLTLFGITLASADPLTFNTTPLGQKDRPIILRTYVPDPGLDPAVLSNHGEAPNRPNTAPIVVVTLGENTV